MRYLHASRHDIGSVKDTITIYHGVRCKFGAKCECSRLCLVQNAKWLWVLQKFNFNPLQECKGNGSDCCLISSPVTISWSCRPLHLVPEGLCKCSDGSPLELLEVVWTCCMPKCSVRTETDFWIFPYFLPLLVPHHRNAQRNWLLISSSGSDVGRQPEQWMSPINLDRFRDIFKIHTLFINLMPYHEMPLLINHTFP